MKNKRHYELWAGGVFICKRYTLEAIKRAYDEYSLKWSNLHIGEVNVQKD